MVTIILAAFRNVMLCSPFINFSDENTAINTYSLVVTIYTIRFIIEEFYILPTCRIDVFCMDATTNSVSPIFITALDGVYSAVQTVYLIKTDYVHSLQP